MEILFYNHFSDLISLFSTGRLFPFNLQINWFASKRKYIDIPKVIATFPTAPKKLYSHLKYWYVIKGTNYNDLACYCQILCQAQYHNSMCWWYCWPIKFFELVCNCLNDLYCLFFYQCPFWYKNPYAKHRACGEAASLRSIKHKRCSLLNLCLDNDWLLYLCLLSFITLREIHVRTRIIYSLFI